MIVVKIGKKTSPRENISDEMALLGFIKTKGEIDTLNEELKGYKTVLAEAAKEELSDTDASTVTFQIGDKAVKISFGWDIKIKDPDTLKEVLGERFYDLVEETIVQKPAKKLKEIALEDDGIRECLEIKEKTPTVTAVKAL